MVSGSSDPDTITLSRSSTGTISISKKEIGAKRTQIILHDDQGGTKEMEVDPDLTQKLSITEDQALRLGEVGALLEKRFGNPRDVEWAFSEVWIFIKTINQTCRIILILGHLISAPIQTYNKLE